MDTDDGGLKIKISLKRPAEEQEIIEEKPKKEKKEKKEKKSKKDKKSKKEKKAKKAKKNETPEEPEDYDQFDETGIPLAKLAKVHSIDQYSEERKDFMTLPLKADHASRPLWVCPDGHIFLETFSPVYKQAYDFLIAIAEPESRPHLVHEYQLTMFSLYAAVSVGLPTETIISVLNRLSKTELPKSIEKFIRECTASWGKVKLVLQRNRFFIESQEQEVLQTLLRNEAISKAWIRHQTEFSVDPKTGLITSRAPQAAEIPGGSASNTQVLDPALESDDLQAKITYDDDEEERVDSVQQSVHSFEIDAQQVEHVKRECILQDFPTLEEYDFRNDIDLANLAIDLKPTTVIRPYQEKSLSKMFGNGRARSGIIVLPCGAGKTLVGVTATCTLKKNTIVLCTSGVSVQQWRFQYKLWSNIEDNAIARFTSDEKEFFTTPAGILVTTYSMIAFSGKRSKESKEIMERIRNIEWGLIVLDEVHVVPANMFRTVLTSVRAHCKMGLTATLLREDVKIGDLNFLIGPKLYEANWLDLQQSGFLARVQCVEVWCPMTPEFFQEYLNTDSHLRRTLLYIMNPNKYRTCEFLIRYHEERGDKIIVFSDNIFAIRNYAMKMKRPFIYGPTSSTERMRILQQFQHNPALKTLFLSRVGDTSIDLPEANVIIQISSQSGSRRQEAQRLGRILRPKAKSDDEFNAFFYSLVSRDTQEMYFSSKRQQFLIDQGYSFKVIAELPGVQDDQTLGYAKKEEQMGLLREVLTTSEEEGKTEILPEDKELLELKASGRPAVTRTAGSFRSVSGAEGRLYMEVKGRDKSQPPTAILKKPGRHALFNHRNR